MDWKPIETAPKDGTPVILYGGGGSEPKEVVVGWWAGSHLYPWAFIDDTAERIEGCCDNEAEGRIEPNAWAAGYGPTHWMPLPPPPEES